MELETYVWFENENEYLEFKVSFDYDFGQVGISSFSSWENSHPATADQVYITKIHCDNLPTWITEDMIEDKVKDNAVDIVNEMYD